MKKKIFSVALLAFLGVLSVKGQLLESNLATDWNKLQKSGFYSILGNAGSNSPVTTAQWYWGINSGYINNVSTNQYYNAQIAVTIGQPAQMYIRNTDKAGIGSWAKVLTETNGRINGALQVFNTANGGHLILSANDNSGQNNTQIGIDFKIADKDQIIGKISSFYDSSVNGGYGGLRFYSKNAGVLKESMRIASHGFVGIGTTTPDQLLTVKGKIHAQEVLIDLSGPLADYVFKSDYNLMPLGELEQFVKTNSHLPEIPTAAHVEENGLSVGEMQNKLLQKIEELTLYVIDQNKKIEVLQEENKAIKQQLNNR